MFLSTIGNTTMASEKSSFSLKSSEEKRNYVQDVFNRFNKDTLNILDGFYTTDVDFIDPLGNIKGLANMKAYYANMYKNVISIKFDFTEGICDGNNCVFVWKMTFAAKSLKGGEPVIAYGNSHIKFNDNGLVYFHRDYFDMGEFIYEHIPVVGFLVKKVKSQLAHK